MDFDKEIVVLEVPSSGDEISEFFWPTSVVRVSPVLRQEIDKFIIPDKVSNASEQVQSPLRVKGRIFEGYLHLSGFQACHSSELYELFKWMQYHVSDELFEQNCRFTVFEQSEYEKEQERLAEKPCYFDWNFITKLGGGDTLKEENKVLFYNVLALADQLGLESLVLLAGKYICQFIHGMSVIEVRQVLGLTDDVLPAKIENRIQTANKAIFKPQPIRYAEPKDN